MNSKFPQKLTFNFIKQFGSEGQSISFNELNLRKCLTIRLKQPALDVADTQNRSSKSLLQILNDFENPTQVESLEILLRFSLNSLLMLFSWPHALQKLGNLMGFTDKQMAAMEQWQKNAKKAAAEDKAPSRTALKQQQGKGTGKKAKKKMKKK